MGNTGRSSTGCALCRKRKIKVGSTIDFRRRITSYLLSNSVTRESLDANDALKYASLVQATLSKFNYKYAHLRPARLRDQTAHPSFLALSSLPTTQSRHYHNNSATQFSLAR